MFASSGAAMLLRQKGRLSDYDRRRPVAVESRFLFWYQIICRRQAVYQNLPKLIGATGDQLYLSRRSRNQTGLPTHAAAPRPYGQFWMIRRSTSARFVPADAGAKDKNPMGSMLFSAPIIASSVPDCHQILRKSCQESVRGGIRFFADRTAKKWPLRGSLKYAGVLLAYPP